MKERVKYFRIIIVCLIHLLVIGAFAQEEKQALQKQKWKIDDEIQYTNNLLEETQKNKQTSLNELSILSNKIDKREELIITIAAEIRYLEQQIKRNEENIQELNKELEDLRDEYAGMIYYAFKNKDVYDRLMFIFSSEDFNQAYRRMKYLQQYSIYRKVQAELISEKQLELEQTIADLEKQKEEKEGLKLEKEEEMKRLDNNRQQKDETVTILGNKERDLRRQLREKEQAANRLQNAIEAIIAEEIRKAAEESGTPSSEQMFALTPEEMELSNTFATNKGKLPWPTERGIISGRFGEQPHPVLNGIKVKNNGVDIMTNINASARAVFEGEVTRIISVPKYNNVVILRHGEYLTVYSNLDDVTVSVGDKIATKQQLGIIHTDTDDTKTELHFEMWKGKELLNPSLWMAKSGW